jgi:hypothetical protein
LFQIVSVQFVGCFKPFPVVAIRTSVGERDFRLLSNDIYTFISKELIKEGVTVVRYLADSPERHMALGVQRSGTYGFVFRLLSAFNLCYLWCFCNRCEFCSARAEPENRVRRHNVDSLLASRRTVDEARAANLLPKDSGDRKGIQNESPLFLLYDAQGFDPFRQTPVEPLHNIDLGLTKLMLERLTPGQSKSVRRFLKSLSNLLLSTSNLHEHPRRPRSMNHFLRFKGHELNFIGMSVFPTIFNDLLEIFPMQKDIEMWR